MPRQGKKMSQATKDRIAASVRQTMARQKEAQAEGREQQLSGVGAPSYRGGLSPDDPYLLGKREAGPRFRCRCGALSEGALTEAQLRGAPIPCARCRRTNRIGG